MAISIKQTARADVNRGKLTAANIALITLQRISTPLKKKDVFYIKI